MGTADAGGQIEFEATAIGEAGESIEVRLLFGLGETAAVVGQLDFESAHGLLRVVGHLLNGAAEFFDTGNETGAETGDVFEL